MAIASANAQARSIGTRILLAASGLRPIDSIAFEPIIPIATAGAIAPIAITIAFANVAESIIFSVLIPTLSGRDSDFTSGLIINDH